MFYRGIFETSHNLIRIQFSNTVRENQVFPFRNCITVSVKWETKKTLLQSINRYLVALLFIYLICNHTCGPWWQLSLSLC